MKQKNKSSFELKAGVVLISLGVICYLVSLVTYLLKIEVWSIFSFLGVCYATIGIALYTNRKKDNQQSTNKPQKKDLSPELKEKYDRVIEYVKAKYSAVSYHIDEITTDEPIQLTDSKFGGYPYWTADKEYPTAANGENLYLLAQVNFEQMAPDDGLLPKNGILQFFTKNDNLCGANFEDPTDQKDFRVIYHSEIGEPLSVERLRERGIKANTDLTFQESMLPSVFEDAIRFTKAVDYVSDNSDEFEEYVKEAMFELYGQTFEDTLWHELDHEDYYYLERPFNDFDHKILGVPNFTQSDPRYKESEVPEGKKANTVEHYNVLLLQINSEGHTMWGDSGVANFFINSEDLKNLDFSDVLYNWDCF